MTIQSPSSRSGRHLHFVEKRNGIGLNMALSKKKPRSTGRSIQRVDGAKLDAAAIFNRVEFKKINFFVIRQQDRHLRCAVNMLYLLLH